MLVVSVVGGGLGALLATSPPSKEIASELGAPPAAQNVGLLDLPPIVANLGAPPDMWVRIEAAMVFDPKTAPHPETIGAEIANDIVAYIRTVTLAQIQGPSGLQSFRQSLNERASVRSGGKVTEIVFRTMVIQ
jgi:flagellar protein FliL